LMFTCNRMLVFFFIYIFIFLLLSHDDYLYNFFELNFIDFRNSMYSEKRELWHFSFIEHLDHTYHNSETFINEYEWEYEEIAFDDLTPIQNLSTAEITSHITTNSTEQLKSNFNKQSEFLDNIYFFDRWLGLSNEIFSKLYFTRQLNSIKQKNIRLKVEYLLNSKKIYEELQKEFLITFKLFRINPIFLKFNGVLVKPLNTLKDLTKFFLFTNFIIHDDISYIIKYFKIKLIQVKDPNVKKKRQIFTFWGHNNARLVNLNLNKYLQLKFINFNIFSKKYYDTNAGWYNYSLNDFSLNSVKFSYVSDFFFFSGFCKNLFHVENKNLYLKLNKYLILKYSFIKIIKKKYYFIASFSNFNFNIFYKIYLKFLLENIPEIFLFTPEEKEILEVNLSLNEEWFIYYPKNFVNKILNNIIERQFRIILKSFFNNNNIDFHGNIQNNFKFIKLFNKFFIQISKNFFNIFFKDLFFIKLNFLVLNYRLILYKILAKGWKYTKTNKIQIKLLKIFNNFIKNINPVEFSFQPYKTENFSQRHKKKKKFIDFFFFTFLFFKSSKSHWNITYNIKNKIKFLNKNKVDRYSQLFYYTDPLTNQFFLNRYKKRKKIRNLSFLKNQIGFIKFIPYKLFYGITDLTYFLLYFLPNLLAFEKTNLRYVIVNKLFQRIYKFLFLIDSKLKISKDFFFFPFLSDNLKKFNEKNLFLNQLYIQLEAVYQSNFISEQVLIKKSVLKFLNKINFIKFNIDFIFILDILKILIFSTLKNNLQKKSIFAYFFSYNKDIYKKRFIRKMLITYVFKIKNIKHYKYNLSLYFYKYFSRTFSKNFFTFKLQKDLNIFDYEILNSIFNRYWAIGFPGPITEISRRMGLLKKKKKAPKKVMKRGYITHDPYYQFPLLGLLSVVKDYYPTNWSYFMSLLYFIDGWLKKKHLDLEDLADSEDYKFLWVFLIFFWLVCRWLRLFTPKNESAQRIYHLTRYERFSDYYKSWFPKLISSGANNFLGLNYVGMVRGVKKPQYATDFLLKNYVLPTAIYGPFISYKDPIFDINENLQLIRKEKKKDDNKKDLKHYGSNMFNVHKLEELRFTFSEPSLLINDYFRFRHNRKILTKNKLKWLIYGNLRSSLNLNNYEQEYDYNVLGNTLNNSYSERKRGGEFKIQNPIAAPLDSIKVMVSFLSNNLKIQQQYHSRILNYLTLKYFFIFKKKIFPYYLKERHALFHNYSLNQKKTLNLDLNDNLPLWLRNWVPLSFYKEEFLKHHKIGVGLLERYRIFTEYRMWMEMSKKSAFEIYPTGEQVWMSSPARTVGLEKQYLKQAIYQQSLGRPIRRYQLSLFQGFFYDTVLKKSKENKNQINFLKYNVVLHYLNRNILGSIHRNISQYKNILRRSYNDAIYNIPMYFNIIYNLNPILLKDFLIKTPDFYHLIFRKISLFSEEPFLNIPYISLNSEGFYKQSWHKILYQNPWFIKKLDINKYKIQDKKRVFTFPIPIYSENKLFKDLLNYKQNSYINRLNKNLKIFNLINNLNKEKKVSISNLKNTFWHKLQTSANISIDYDISEFVHSKDQGSFLFNFIIDLNLLDWMDKLFFFIGVRNSNDMWPKYDFDMPEMINHLHIHRKAVPFDLNIAFPDNVKEQKKFLLTFIESLIPNSYFYKSKKYLPLIPGSIPPPNKDYDEMDALYYHGGRYNKFHYSNLLKRLQYFHNNNRQVNLKFLDSLIHDTFRFDNVYISPYLENILQVQADDDYVKKNEFKQGTYSSWWSSKDYNTYPLQNKYFGIFSLGQDPKLKKTVALSKIALIMQNQNKKNLINESRNTTHASGKFLKKYLTIKNCEPRTRAELRSSMQLYPYQYIYNNKVYESPLKPYFRSFRKETYNKLKGEYLYNIARQFVENLHEYSDSLFEGTSNYNFYPTILGTNEIGNIESDMVDQWYEPRQYLEFSTYSYTRIYTSIVIWPWLSRTIYKLPHGSPPLVRRNALGFPEKNKNYLAKNNRLYYPGRFRHPLHADDFNDLNAHILEEGTFAQFFLYPLVSNIYDTFLSFYKNFLLFFDRTKFFYFIQSYNGVGDFYYRPLEFRDGILKNSRDISIALDRYNWKYGRVQKKFLKTTELSYLNLIFSLSYNSGYSNKWLINLEFKIRYFINYLTNILNRKTWMDLWFNNLFMSHRYIIFSFISFFFALYYIFWVPIVYIVSLFRNWIYYPLLFDPQAQDDSSLKGGANPSPLYTGYTVFPNERIYRNNKDIPTRLNAVTFEADYFKQGILEDTGISFNTEDLAFEVIEYFVNFYMAVDFGKSEGLGFRNFKYMEESNLNLFLESTHTLLSNEIYFLNHIFLPGKKFTYNFFDMYSLVNAEFKLSQFKAPLPQYRAHFIEFLSILTGYKKSFFDNQQEFILNRDELFNYFIDQNSGNLHTFRKTKELRFDNIVSSNYFDDLNQLDLKTRYNQFSSFEKKKNEGLSLNNLPTTIWYANKIFIDGLDYLNFNINYLNSNSIFNVMLDAEKYFFCLNLLDFSVDPYSWFNNSKINLLNLQYKSSEKILPFYLRFVRNTTSLKDLSYLNEPLRRNLKIYAQKNSYDLLQPDNFDKVAVHDLFMVQPENHEGLLDIEASLGILSNIKNYFEMAIIAENFDNLGELLLDFHILETDEWYNHALFKMFLSVRGDHFDWLRTVEETKNWIIYLDPNRFIGLNTTKALKNKIFLYEFDTDLLNEIYFLNFVNYKNPLKQIHLNFRRSMYFLALNRLVSKQTIVPTHMSIRFYEEPLFPDREFYFSDALIKQTSKQVSNQFLSLKKLFFKKNNFIFSNSMFCHAMSLQLINLEITEDINKILTPLHRSVNKKLNYQSSLQLYSYFNLFFIERRLLNYTDNFKNLLKVLNLKKKKTFSKFFFFIFFLLFQIFNILYLLWLS